VKVQKKIPGNIIKQPFYHDVKKGRECAGNIHTQSLV
jgi:hypothetical protein